MIEHEVWAIGTYRVLPPEATVARARELFPVAGITRLADLTGLDEIGIPVYQAVRPNAKTLSVAQGKGIAPVLAQASAAMEALEFWHAENISLPGDQLRVSDAATTIGYDPFELSLSAPSFLHDRTRLEWLPARSLVTDRPSLLPRESIDLGAWASLDGPFSVPLFRVSTNGLASGNSLAEAILHALLELIERDSTQRAEREAAFGGRRIDLDSVATGPCRELVGLFRGAGVTVVVNDITGPTGIPTFVAGISSPDLPAVHRGFGCHLSPEIALSRALTEAAQVRLTVIAGTRDDLPVEYAWARRILAPAPVPDHATHGVVPFETVSGIPFGQSLEEDVRHVAELVADLTGYEPVAVDLTKPVLDLPVAFVAAPGLRPYAHMRR